MAVTASTKFVLCGTVVALMMTSGASIFGIKFPKYFVDLYDYDTKLPIPYQQLEADLETLRQGAENGFQFPCVDTSQGSCRAADLKPDGNNFVSNAVNKLASSARRFYQHLTLQKTQEEREWEEQQLSGELLKNIEQGEVEMRQRRDEIVRQQSDMAKMQAAQQHQQEQLRIQQQQLEQEQQRWEAEQRRLAEEKRRLEKERQEQQRRAWAFSARGDPRLCPEDANGNTLEKECIEYHGPATIMCFNVFGNLQSIDFVGVCEKDGSNCQSKEAYWVGEQWRYDLQNKTWKYRDVTGKHVADVSCANNWPTEALPSEQPLTAWLEAFNNGRSFILHAMQPRIMNGPSFQYIWTTLMGKDVTKASFDVEHVGQWVNAMLMMHGYATHKKVEGAMLNDFLPKYSVFYGIAAHYRSLSV